MFLRRIWKFKEEHQVYLNFGPTRRYSEIAETWDEDEEEDQVLREDTSLLQSYKSNTSYGALLGDKNLAQCKVLVDMHP